MSNITSSDSELSSFISNLPYTYKVSNKSVDIISDYNKYEGKNVSMAGRVMAVRKAGKLLFVDILDQYGKMQCYFDYNKMGEELFKSAKSLNAGDIIGVEGIIFKTKPGEISINVDTFNQLSKAIKNLPDKWKGLMDVESRYRKRYLDLIVNPQVREIFIKRSLIIKLIREFLESHKYTEFETPVIQPLYGGADSEPFRVFVNTLNEEDYLRISNELYLKRLIIGGYERIYEIYKAFRNEDLDTTHSPEFTMLEAYMAYADYNDMMSLNENMFNKIAKHLFGGEEFEYQGKKISFKIPFARVSYADEISKHIGKDVMKLTDDELFAIAEQHGVRFDKGKRTRAHAYDKLFSNLVQPNLIQPTFAIDFPRETSPLTRPKRGNSTLTERFELYICGIELSNAYSELNNPIIQRENFRMEEEKAALGDKEAEPLDNEFVEAMEYRMPPTGGIGIGIDRLTMILTNQSSIKEVIMFPMEKRHSSNQKQKDNKSNQ